MVFDRLAPFARRVGIAVARPAAALVAIGVLALATVWSGLVTAEQLGPLVAGSQMADELAADADLSVATAPSSFDGLATVDYAGLRVALIEARVVTSNSTGWPIVVADLAVGNDTGRSIRLTRPMVRLVGPEDLTTELTRFDYSVANDRVVVEPGAAGRALAVFLLRPGAEDDVALYRLEIGEPGRWPTVLPLGGEPPAALPAQEVTPVGVLGGDAGPVEFGAGTVEVIGVTADVEYGAYRARIGQRVLALTVEVTGSPEDRARLADPAYWQLVSATESGPVVPEQDGALGVVVEGGAQSPGPPAGQGTGPSLLTVVFTRPVEAADLVVVLDPHGSPRPLVGLPMQLSPLG